MAQHKLLLLLVSDSGRRIIANRPPSITSSSTSWGECHSIIPSVCLPLSSFLLHVHWSRWDKIPVPSCYHLDTKLQSQHRSKPAVPDKRLRLPCLPVREIKTDKKTEVAGNKIVWNREMNVPVDQIEYLLTKKCSDGWEEEVVQLHGVMTLIVIANIFLPW